MINMINKYKDELDIYGAMETSDPEVFFIEAPHEYFEIFHIDILEQLYDVLDEYIQEDDDPIIYKDYMIVKDYLELYNAINY
jgi:hypothetical protein